ncbi:MAG: cysteate synthase [Bacteroidales bacterium]|nr:cysteate synthase [Candidatus Cryptobacteroides onthequi]
MKFTPTSYQLMNVIDGHILSDAGWTLADPDTQSPSLVRAIYETKQFTPREDLDGIYRYANWLPISRVLKKSCAPVTYKSKGLAEHLGLDNLYITFSGYNPKIGATMETCSFKETEAFSVCGRLPKNSDKVLVVQSAGNTARAFAQVCSDNNIPIVICVPADNFRDLWFRSKLNSCVKMIATPSGSDYFDAIALGDKICQSPRYFAEGGAKNVARRDGMGTTLLSAVECIGRIPDAYFQAVGSGTGAIAAWENNLRLIEDGRFGTHKMKLFVSQNIPFTIMYDSWKAHQRQLLDLTPEQSRRDAEVILAKVLSNRKPPYSIAGGLFDALEDTGGDFFKVTNDEIVRWILMYRNLEGYDIFPAAATAVASLAQAVESGQVKKEDVIMVNVTGGGSLAAQSRGYYVKEPDLVISPDLPAAEIIAQVDALFEKPARKRRRLAKESKSE